MSLLTNDMITQFQNDGFIVIENVITSDEIVDTRCALHNELMKYGIDHDKILSGEIKPSNDIRIKSDVSNIFYAKFKIKLQLRDAIYQTWKHAMSALVNDNYPIGDNVLPYIDRICYRLPDIIREEGGLDLHIDRRPQMGSNGLENIKKYRPIQGFISLTDHYGSDSGGLKVVKGFHHIFDEYFAHSKEDFGTSGEFFRMHSKSHTKIQKQCEALIVPAGSMVLWDNRLPHATCSKLSGNDSREVIYLSYIPNIPLNILYCQKQAKNFVINMPPPSYSDNIRTDRTYDIDQLSVREQKMLLLI